MENNAIKQWNELSKSSMENLKHVIESNINSTTSMFQQFTAPSSFAQMGKASMDFSKEL